MITIYPQSDITLCNYYEQYNYLLYMMAIHIKLLTIKMKNKIKCQNNKLLNEELEKYDSMEKLLNHCSNLCLTDNAIHYYDDIETIYNSFMQQMYSQNYHICLCSKYLKNIIGFDELKKNNFKYNVIKHYQINLLDSQPQFKQILMKNTILTKLKNNNYKNLFDIIDMVNNTFTINNTYNMSFVKMYKYIDMNIFIKAIKTVIKCFITDDYVYYFMEMIKNESCKKCMLNTMQFLLFKSEITKSCSKIKNKIRNEKQSYRFELKLAKKYFIFLSLYFYFVSEDIYSNDYQYKYLLRFIEYDDDYKLIQQTNKIKKLMINHQKLMYYHNRKDIFHLDEMLNNIQRNIKFEYDEYKKTIINYVRNL
jgi:hypothetical protein